MVYLSGMTPKACQARNSYSYSMKGRTFSKIVSDLALSKTFCNEFVWSLRRLIHRWFPKRPGGAATFGRHHCAATGAPHSTAHDIAMARQARRCSFQQAEAERPAVQTGRRLDIPRERRRCKTSSSGSQQRRCITPNGMSTATPGAALEPAAGRCPSMGA